MVRPGNCAVEQFQLPMRVAQTLNLLPGQGLLTGTSKAQLFRCEHLY